MKNKKLIVMSGILCLALLSSCTGKKNDSEMQESNMIGSELYISEEHTEMENSLEMENSGEMESSVEVGSSKESESSKYMAKDFSLEDINGNIHKLSDYKGKKAYIKFWASWCSICLSSLEETDELAKKEDKDFVVLSVVAPEISGEKSIEEFKEWYAKLGYKNIPVLFDVSGELMEEYSIMAFPTAIYIDSDGAFAKKEIGYTDSSIIEKNMQEIK